MKTCSRCRRSLTLSMFHKDKTKVDGLYTVCKECRKGVTAEPVLPSGWRICKVCGEAKPEIGFYKASGNKKRRTCISCSDKKWKKSYRNITGRIGNGIKNLLSLLGNTPKKAISRSNPDYRKRNAEADKRYRRSEKGTERRKTWVENNRDWLRTFNNNREAQKRNLPSGFTADDWIKTKSAFGNVCAYCGKSSPLAQDHYHPLSKGGGFILGNIVPACKSCNSRKSNHNPRDIFPLEKCYFIERKLRELCQ